MTQTPIGTEFNRLNSVDGSTLICIWKIRENILNDVAIRTSTRTRLHDDSSQRFIKTAINHGTNVHYHFLVECKTTRDIEVTTFLAQLGETYAEALRHADARLQLDAPKKSRAHMLWYVHCFDRNVLIDCFDHSWIHVVPPNETLGWLLFDHKVLRLRLKGIGNPWKYTTLAVPLTSDDVDRTLERLGYDLDPGRGWGFTGPRNPDDRQSPLGRWTFEKSNNTESAAPALRGGDQ
jgi:hypothetical protein